MCSDTANIDNRHLNVVRTAAAKLKAVGLDSADYEVKLLLEQVLSQDPLLLSSEYVLTDTQLAEFSTMLSLREKRIPLQYILGTAPFGPIELLVGEGVFIPRFETELMLEKAMAWLQTRRQENPKIMDLASGSGAIGLALANQIANAQIILVEKDLSALQWLKKNIDNIVFAKNVQVDWLKADVTEVKNFLSYRASIDLITFNPPYVPVASEVSPEVAYDPPQAVFAEDNGLQIIKDSIPTLKFILKPGGRFFLEHDETHAAAVKTVFEQSLGFSNLESLLDYAGRTRFLTGIYGKVNYYE